MITDRVICSNFLHENKHFSVFSLSALQAGFVHVALARFSFFFFLFLTSILSANAVSLRSYIVDQKSVLVKR